MRCWLHGLVVVVTACGRIGFDPSAPFDGQQLGDAAADATLGTGPFGQATIVGELSTVGTNEDATLTADRLECYFTSSRAGVGGLDIWGAKRTAVTDPWGPPFDALELDSPSLDATPEIARDGLTLWLSSDRPGGMGGTDVYVSTRATRTVAWSTPVLVPELNSASEEVAAAVDATQLQVVFHTNRSGNYELYTAARVNTATAWGVPSPLAAANSTSFEGDGFFAADGLYFDSNRPGSTSWDLYWAATQGASFATPVLLSVDSPALDQDPWLSDDVHTIVFSSTRSGTAAIYEATR